MTSRSLLLLGLTVLVGYAAGLQDAIETILDPLPPLKSGYIDFDNLQPIDVFVDPLPGYQAEPSNSVRIVGGSEATANGYPYQVAVIIDGSGFCGGSLISTSWVLCAAHCTISARSLQIILGAHNLQTTESTQVSRSASRVINHSGYSSTTLANDISVIYLSSPVTLSRYINTIALAPASSGTFEGSTSRLTGWGRTSDSSSAIASRLQTVTLPILGNTACRNAFGSSVTAAHICTSGATNQGPCNGDSGGPLVVNSAQVGVVSFGSRTCSDTNPAVFTRVSSFRSWISSNANV